MVAPGKEEVVLKVFGKILLKVKQQMKQVVQLEEHVADKNNSLYTKVGKLSSLSCY